MTPFYCAVYLSWLVLFCYGLLHRSVLLIKHNRRGREDMGSANFERRHFTVLPFLVCFVLLWVTT